MWTYIKAQIKRAWNFSRTIFLNAASIVMLMAGDVLGFLIGLDWNTVLSPKAAFYMVAAVNIANIYLRTQTTAAVGKKPKEGAE